MHARRRRLFEPLIVRLDDIAHYLPIGITVIKELCRTGKLDVRQLGERSIGVTFESLKALGASYPPAPNYPPYQGPSKRKAASSPVQLEHDEDHRS
jgi:hypothetical protein